MKKLNLVLLPLTGGGGLRRKKLFGEEPQLSPLPYEAKITSEEESASLLESGDGSNASEKKENVTPTSSSKESK